MEGGQLEKQRYMCQICGFTFSRNDKPNNCPYCGREGVLSRYRIEDLFES